MRTASNFLVSTSRRGLAHHLRGLPSAGCQSIKSNAPLLWRQQVVVPPHQAASFSTNEGPSGISGWMESRKERQEKENYMEQMERLSNMEELTLLKYREELDRGLDSWGAKLSFGLTKEIKLAKEVVACINCFIEVLGNDATADDLIEMDRLQRLKVATASNKSMEDIQIMISQVQNMDLMQRTLRKRKAEGKPIPPDSNSMQAAIKKDALSVMSKSQKEMMMKRQMELGRRMARKRR
ncbi:unnamed protein product [Cylindrotheca closterium]|uniref:Signal recognition particle SRP54 subunit M-domain domain-containing protein n=1 Tax=Cylindrotheca closterium TaxID=2856 RepID=A0AAD2CV96_9STRA|nr:unnamed protein product [Cylindrotheca closterium]